MLHQRIAYLKQALITFAKKNFARKRVVFVNKYIVIIYVNEQEKDKLHLEYLFDIEYVPHTIIVRV